MNITRNVTGLASNASSQSVSDTGRVAAVMTTTHSMADMTTVSGLAVISTTEGAATAPSGAAAGRGAGRRKTGAERGVGKRTDEEVQEANAADKNATSIANVTLSSGNLFCWALMMPHGYEVALMRTLVTRGAGIFGCNTYDVFSSGDIELSPGPPVRIGTTDIGSVKCSYGGKWHLALNSPVFIKVWKKVFKMRRYLQSEWTVKVDPDAVFIPERLRKQMQHADPDARVYFNNCDQGLHGPIEVIARGGMRKFGEGLRKCEKKLEHEFWEFGEDVFLRHCLGFLKVYRVDNFHLLSEDRCMWEDPARTGCYSGKVAFHPFKSPDKYFICLKQALHGRGDKKNESSQGDDKNETKKL